MVAISEIFVSIQGEGPFTGHPCVFVRVGGCNFTCPKFGPNGCDSNFSVDAKNKKDWKQYTKDQLKIEIINFMVKNSLDLIVFTGGEPLLHQEFMEVAAELSKVYKIQIETNGSRFHKFNLTHFCIKNTTIVSSPKLSNAGNSFDYTESMNSIDKDNLFFKFVVGSKEDIKEVEEFLEKYIIPKDRVYLMPLGENIEQITKNSQFVWEYCSVNGFLYSDRLHIRIYNDKRGV